MELWAIYKVFIVAMQMQKWVSFALSSGYKIFRTAVNKSKYWMSEVCVCIVAVVMRHANGSSSWAVSYCHLWHVWPLHIHTIIDYVIKKICPTSFRETCEWLKFPLNGLRAQSRVSPVVGLLPLASGSACLGMAFPPFLMKQLYRCDSVVVSLFVRRGYTTRRWGCLLGRIGYSIKYHWVG